AALQRGGRSTRVEVFMRRTGGEPAVVCVLPERKPAPAVAAILGRYVDRDGRLQGDPAEAVPALVRDLDGHRAAVRISKEVALWAAGRARRTTLAVERQNVEEELRSGRRSLAALKLPLYPYQVDGLLHLAFTERALLGDEMGLGKTAQAVAASALLRELRGVARVLIVCPVSLKGGPDHQVHRSDATLRAGHEARSARLLRDPRLLHHRQLRAGDARRRGREPAAPSRRGDPGRGAADQELEHADGPRDQTAREPLRVPPHRDADREPHRRDLLDHRLRGPAGVRSALPLQPDLLRAGRAWPPRGLPEPRR